MTARFFPSTKPLRRAGLNRSESRWGAVKTLPVLPAHTMPKLEIAGPLSRASAAIASRPGPAPKQLPKPIVMIGCAPAAVGGAKMENAVNFSGSDHLLDRALKSAADLGAETRLIRLNDLKFRACEGYY